jgi:hypothetical protein
MTTNQLIKEFARVLDAPFAKRDRVRILAAKPLPSGKTVQLVAMVDFIRPDGLIDVRVCSAGLYSGGIFKVRADEIKRIG